MSLMLQLLIVCAVGVDSHSVPLAATCSAQNPGGCNMPRARGAVAMAQIRAHVKDEMLVHVGEGELQVPNTTTNEGNTADTPTASVAAPLTSVAAPLTTLAAQLTTVAAPITTVAAPLTTVEPPVEIPEATASTVEPPMAVVEAPETTMGTPSTTATTADAPSTTTETPSTTSATTTSVSVLGSVLEANLTRQVHEQAHVVAKTAGRLLTVTEKGKKTVDTVSDMYRAAKDEADSAEKEYEDLAKDLKEKRSRKDQLHDAAEASESALWKLQKDYGVAREAYEDAKNNYGSAAEKIKQSEEAKNLSEQTMRSTITKLDSETNELQDNIAKLNNINEELRKVQAAEIKSRGARTFPVTTLSGFSLAAMLM